MIQSQVGVGKGLRLYALRGVHNQDGPLASRQRAADLVVKVYMAGGVDQVKFVVLAIFGVIAQRHCMSLNGNAPLPLQVHIIENLLLHISLLHRTGQFQQSVRQSGLAVVNVGNDGKIANVLFLYSQWSSSESQ